MLSNIARARTFGLAAEMSFWLFLSLVPLAAVAGWLAARVATSDAGIASWLLASVPAETRQLLDTQVQLVAAWHGSRLAPLAAGTFLWLAAGGVHAVFEALEVQSGTSRPWWKKRVLALATCLTLAIGSALVAFLAVGFGRGLKLAGRPGSVVLVYGPIADALRWLTAVLLAVAMTAGLYRVGVPYERGGARCPALPGALLSVVLQVLLGWGYGFYLSKLGGGSAYQAGLAVVAITLTTLWLFSVSLLLGANLNAAVAATRRRIPGGAPREEAEVAPHLRYRDPWPSSDASSSRPTLPKPPTGPSSGPSTSPPASVHRSR